MSLWVFFQKGDRKIFPFFIYAICLSGVSVTLFPTTIINVSVSFFLSILLCWKSFYQSINQTILWWLILLMLTATFVLWLHSPHYGGILGLLRMLKIEIIEKYLVICYAFYIFKNSNSLNKLLIVCFYSLLVLTFFGILNMLFGHAIFVDWALEGTTELSKLNQDAGSKFELSERFRVMAMHPNPFNYGFICSLLLILFIYGRDKIKISKYIFYLSLLCCVFGIVVCGCRTIIAISLIGFFVYYTLTRGFRKSLLFYICFFLLFVLILVLSPSMVEKLNFFMTIFDEKSNVSGSSDLNMRAGQFASVIYYIRENFLFGLGKDYFYIDLDWNSGKSTDKELFGMEGVYLDLLLERGFVGLLFYLFFWSILLCKYVYSIRMNKLASALGLSIVSSYLVFAIMTGELYSVLPTLLLCGYAMAEIYKCKISNQAIG